MARVWEVHVERKESEDEFYLASFDTRGEAVRFLANCRENLRSVFKEPIVCWLYQYEAHLNDRVRVNGHWRRTNHG